MLGCQHKGWEEEEPQNLTALSWLLQGSNRGRGPHLPWAVPAVLEVGGGAEGVVSTEPSTSVAPQLTKPQQSWPCSRCSRL